MDDHQIIIDLKKLLTVAGETSDKKNILIVLGKSSAGADPEGFAKYFADTATVKIANAENLELLTRDTLNDAILSGFVGNGGMPNYTNLLPTYAALLAAGGTLIAKTEVGTEDKLLKHMKLCGFLNIVVSETIPGVVVGNMPTYKVGSSDKITLNPETKENVISAWKLDDNNSETISEDDLLEADDLKKPASSTLRVCATTKKPKACKDCSCGLAEELEANRLKDTPKPDTSNAKSSCGSCYLGDAFRCASCPYLGMPAFKPGEKVQLTGNLLQDDL